ncbi:MutS-like protein [Bonamia ostreae]|uniref:MutS-like protein n=1 Tax=Bonamia ostreae TaxID=126728 RepID=A0ABV2ASW5_9EUKA
MIEKVIDLESVKNHDYRINPKFTESIFNMATEINNLKEEMENEKLIILKKSNLKIKIDKVFPFGFHFVSPKNVF